MTRGRGNRAPFARATGRAAKRVAGRTDVTTTPLNVRTTGLSVDDASRKTVRARLGAKLGKFAARIERLSVRFEDINGPRGGVDTRCRVKVVLSGLDSVVFEATGRDVAEATSMAASGIERAVRRELGRAGGGKRSSAARTSARAERGEETHRVPRSAQTPATGSLIGRRVGQRADNLEAALERPEKRRRDVPVDTSQPGASASDRRAGGGHTARRNTKRNTARATSALEDSTLDRPSRKSTRRAASRSKRDSNLQRRQVRRVHSSKARAARSAGER